jgi:iron complex transport system substrate-binding protein
VGASEQADKIIGMMQRAIESMRAATMALPRRRVHCEEWGKPILLSQPWVRELVEAAGGEFLGTPTSRVEVDDVIAADPEVILAAWCGAGDRAPMAKIVRERGWENLTAVRENRVFSILDDYLNTPAPTLIYGLQALAAAIHPEKFPGVNGLKSMEQVPSVHYA